MSQIILDMGSGNTCKNNMDYAYKMIDAVAAIDSHKHEVIFKWQLFENEPPNVPLDHLVFGRAYAHAKGLGYKTTSSVFDKKSLDFLLNFDIPFVKIACRPMTYWLLGEVPRKIPVVLSWSGEEAAPFGDYRRMFCIPQYPADPKKYLARGAEDAISDHTGGLKVWNKLHPSMWEVHFILEDDTNNPDAVLGHAIKPDLLKEVIGA